MSCPNHLATSFEVAFIFVGVVVGNSPAYILEIEIMAAIKTNTAAAVATLPSREQFIAEYLASKANPDNRVGLLTRLTNFVEDKTVDMVADSTRLAGRVSAAASAAGDGFHQAAAVEHARQAERMAIRLGL